MRDNIARLTPEQRTQLEAQLRKRSSPASPPQIAARADPTTWPMSAAQMRIWSLNRLRPRDSIYNMQRAWRLVGTLDVAALEASIGEIIQRHEMLRARFTDRSGVPEQGIRPFEGFALSIEPAADSPGLDPLARARRTARAEAERPFDLTNDLLIRVRLVEVDRDDHVLLVTTHHLVCDGWSMDVIEREIAAIYASLRRGLPPSLDPLPFQYADFAAWQDQRRGSPIGERDLEYWTARLQAPVSPLQLPGSRQTRAQRMPVGGHLKVSLDRELTSAIETLSRNSRVTPFMALLTGFQLTLHQASGQEDILLCSPAAGRIHLQTEQLVGYFNTLVVLRGDLSGDPSVRQLLERNRDIVLEAFDHQGAAFQDVASIPDVATVPLARGLIVLQETSQSPLNLPDVMATPFTVEAENADFELAVFMREVNGRYQSVIRFHRNVLTLEDVKTLMSHLEKVLRTMTEWPDRSVSRLAPVAPGAEAPTSGIDTSNVSIDTTDESSRPSSVLESQLITIWRRLFKKSSISTHDDFFELGGHSLLAAELMAAIESQIVHKPLPLATLFQAPTIAELAEVIAAQGWSDSWDSLVPIQTSGLRPPLFFVHAHGGNVIGYRDLARHLGNDQPFYGLQAPELRSNKVEKVPRRLEDMAARYICALQTVQPRGPYLLGGWCLGGDVAFEMAHQLNAAGEEVAVVVMVDNPRPEFLAPEMTVSRARRVWNRTRTRFRMERSNLTETPWRRQPRYLANRLLRLGQLGLLRIEKLIGRLIAIPHSRTYYRERVAAAHEKAYEAHSPNPYSGRVTLVRAEEQPFGRAPDRALGWNQFIEGDLDIIEAPGHRMGLLSEPRVGRVAEQIRGAMDRALADAGQSDR